MAFFLSIFLSTFLLPPLWILFLGIIANDSLWPGLRSFSAVDSFPFSPLFCVLFCGCDRLVYRVPAKAVFCARAATSLVCRDLIPSGLSLRVYLFGRRLWTVQGPGVSVLWVSRPPVASSRQGPGVSVLWVSRPPVASSRQAGSALVGRAFPKSQLALAPPPWRRWPPWVPLSLILSSLYCFFSVLFSKIDFCFPSWQAVASSWPGFVSRISGLRAARRVHATLRSGNGSPFLLDRTSVSAPNSWRTARTIGSGSRLAPDPLDGPTHAWIRNRCSCSWISHIGHSISSGSRLAPDPLDGPTHAWIRNRCSCSWISHIGHSLRAHDVGPVPFFGLPLMSALSVGSSLSPGRVEAVVIHSSCAWISRIGLLSRAHDAGPVPFFGLLLILVHFVGSSLSTDLAVVGVTHPILLGLCRLKAINISPAWAVFPSAWTNRPFVWGVLEAWANAPYGVDPFLGIGLLSLLISQRFCFWVLFRNIWVTFRRIWTQLSCPPTPYPVAWLSYAWLSSQVTYAPPILFLAFLLFLTSCRYLPPSPSLSLFPLALCNYLKAALIPLDCINNFQHSFLHRFPSLVLSCTMDPELLHAMDNLHFTAEEAETVIPDGLSDEEDSGSWLSQQPRPGPRRRTRIEYFTEPAVSSIESPPSNPPAPVEATAPTSHAPAATGSDPGGAVMAEVAEASPPGVNIVPGLPATTPMANTTVIPPETAVENGGTQTVDATAVSFDSSSRTDSVAVGPGSSPQANNGSWPALVAVDPGLSAQAVASSIVLQQSAGNVVIEGAPLADSFSIPQQVKPDGKHTLVVRSQSTVMVNATSPTRISKRALQGKYEVRTPIQPKRSRLCSSSGSEYKNAGMSSLNSSTEVAEVAGQLRRAS
ncbi:hypothetical protein V6N12_013786 [Hibiscus sabdariffa]|uniref:Uncharacterized protein n=1 Tax=Hibiscus sabdariffa TaxID=183260 RepID=A0ABR2CV99_9ROSI